MSDFYSKMAATARRLLSSKGSPITITRVTGEVKDPVTRQVTTQGTSNTFTTNGITMPYPDRLIDGKMIVQGDRMVVLDDTVEPAVSDTISMDNEEWLIKHVKTVSPAGTPVVYFAQARR